jgi:hypothetical protein
MSRLKIAQDIDIQAPQEKVFELIGDVERRMQLSSTWGENKIETVSPEYPQEGSRVRLRPAKPEGPSEPGFDLVVTEYQPHVKLAYYFEDQGRTHFIWTLRPSAQGTRLSLEAEYQQVEGEDSLEDGGETHQEKLERQAQEWLTNIKRYAELGDGLLQRLLKRALDGFVLEMPAFQRRVLLILIAFQFVTFLTFLIAALGFAIARLILQ